MLYGVDIHGQYQAGISIPRLAQEGYSFAAVKATQGTGFVAPNFVPWIGQIRAAGMIPGAYHWIVAGNGAAQARFFHAQVKAVGGPTGMLIQLDCEDNASWADVQAWHQEWQRLTGGHPYLIYSGSWWWQPRGWNGAAVTPYLWQSHYLTADTDTISDDPAAFASRIPASWWAPGYGGWPQATIVQFTSQGDAGTLGNNVDLNVYRGSREQLLTLTRPPGGPTTVEDSMAFLDDQNARYLAYRMHDIAEMVDTVTTPQGEQVPNKAVTVIKQIAAGVAALKAAAAEDQTRDAAAFAAINALAAQIQAGGGSVDTVPIVAAVREEAARTRAQVEQLQAALAAKEDELRQVLAAAAQAEADRLKS